MGTTSKPNESEVRGPDEGTIERQGVEAPARLMTRGGSAPGRGNEWGVKAPWRMVTRGRRAPTMKRVLGGMEDAVNPRRDAPLEGAMIDLGSRHQRSPKHPGRDPSQHGEGAHKGMVVVRGQEG
ncbi:hypothetical protein EI94DRAFT_1306092 [Lactarius quietus]|nr:hypothetical protein EI94DRAFT_1306092 [Lactarius quietus]